MNEYRKISTIHAEQYQGQELAGVCTLDHDMHGSKPHIHTLEGILTVSMGDWIATGIEGEQWAIKPHIFETTYELIKESQ